MEASYTFAKVLYILIIIFDSIAVLALFVYSAIKDNENTEEKTRKIWQNLAKDIKVRWTIAIDIAIPFFVYWMGYHNLLGLMIADLVLGMFACIYAKAIRENKKENKDADNR